MFNITKFNIQPFPGQDVLNTKIFKKHSRVITAAIFKYNKKFNLKQQILIQHT